MQPPTSAMHLLTHGCSHCNAAEEPSLSVPETGKRLGAKWNSMTDTEKAPFQVCMLAAMQHHNTCVHAQSWHCMACLLTPCCASGLRACTMHA